MRIYTASGLKGFIILIGIILIFLAVLFIVLQIFIFLLPIILLIGVLGWLFSLFRKKKIKKKNYIDIKAKVK
ncbi:hypothetical protein KY331_04610 [Candidatus Woesearchaeota archaeon]|nr:hypothetical protein [Candidatus Woesearchaeota archaeon]